MKWTWRGVAFRLGLNDFVEDFGMLRNLAAVAVVLVTAGQAEAAAQLSSPSMSCASLKNAVSSAGAAIVSYRSNQVGGLRLYDRLVRNSQFCSADEVTETKLVPALDTPNCPLPRCVPIDCSNER